MRLLDQNRDDRTGRLLRIVTASGLGDRRGGDADLHALCDHAFTLTAAVPAPTVC